MEDKLDEIEDKLSEIASALRQRGFTTQARQSG
jgi:hypothetical protein